MFLYFKNYYKIQKVLGVRLMPYRPRGVNILLVTFIVFAVLGVVTAVGIEFIILPGYPISLIGSSIFSFFYYIFMIQIFSPYFPFPLTPEVMESLFFFASVQYAVKFSQLSISY